jgi:hypothetical protein
LKSCNSTLAAWPDDRLTYTAGPIETPPRAWTLTRLLPPELSDVDGNDESRRGTISVFNGVEPTIETFADPDRETEAVGNWLDARIAGGVPPHEIGVFVRAGGQLRRARAAVKAAGLTAVELSEKVEISAGRVSIGTMHLAKVSNSAPSRSWLATTR